MNFIECQGIVMEILKKFSLCNMKKKGMKNILKRKIE